MQEEKETRKGEREGGREKKSDGKEGGKNFKWKEKRKKIKGRDWRKGKKEGMMDEQTK